MGTKGSGLHRLLLLLLPILLPACSGEEGATEGIPPPPSGSRGQGNLLFELPVGGLSCLDCHSRSAEDQPDRERRRRGPPRGPPPPPPAPPPPGARPGAAHRGPAATRRPSWWHGTLEAAKGAAAGDAVLTCVARFQQRSWNSVLPVKADGSRDLSKVEVPAADLAAIVSYLDTLARPGPHPVSPAARDGTREALARVEALPGDAVRGRTVFAAACVLCHGRGAPGSLGPSLRGDLAPDARRVIAYARRGPSEAERKSADAWMPAFGADVLPDQDLADLAALIEGGTWE